MLRLALAALLLVTSLPAVGAQESTAMLHAIDDGEGSGYAYQPARLLVAPGAEIVVMGIGGEPHTVTPNEGGAFPDTRVEAGGTTSFRAPDAEGEYAFRCKFHPEMQGTLVVRSGAPSSPTDMDGTPPAAEDEPAQTPGLPLAILLGVAALVALAFRRQA